MPMPLSNYEQPLCLRLDPRPATDTPIHLGNDVDAGRDLPLDERLGNPPRLFDRAASREHKPFIGYIRSVTVGRYS